jgi:hypothetical protein
MKFELQSQSSLKAAVGKLRTQRDEAIKARNEVMAYLRQRKGGAPKTR